MQAFQWDKHFETGILEVDEQHHRLVDIINQFGDHLAKNELVSEDINLIIKELSDYTTYHFDEEETMMVQIKQRGITGSPEQVRGRLLQMGSEYGVDDFVILTITHDADTRTRSYELLADAFQLA